MFGKSKDQDQATDPAVVALQTEVERLSSLPLVQLASEVMTKTYSSEDSQFGLSAIADTFAPNSPTALSHGHLSVSRTALPDADEYENLQCVLLEGLQLLEHANLVLNYFQVWNEGGGCLLYRRTRLGEAALKANAVDRILAGGTL